MRPPRYGERASARKRRSLERSLRGIVRDLTHADRLPGASPLNRIGLRPYVDEIERLADRLGDLGRPVSASGLALVRNLLVDGGSPLYERSRADEVPQTVASILARLELS